MKKLLALLLVLVMLAAACLPAFAEEEGSDGSAGAPAETEEVVEEEPEQQESAGSPGVSAEEQAARDEESALLNSPYEFGLIEKDDATGQIRLTYNPDVTTILEVDGLKFKDLNKNGELDVYEDWRADIEDRVWDLIGQLEPLEEAGLHFCSQPALYACRETIRDFKNNCILWNENGSPVIVVNNLNWLQACAEEERLGIPMTFASDREYTAFAGMLDKAHDAFGTANDPELAYQLGYIYGQGMVAIGIHVSFEPYANEIGAQYGENPEHIAAIVSQEIKGLEDAGFASCTKHWIGRGGDDGGFDKAASVAQNWENWMVGWKAALGAGAEWVMTNCDGKGFAHQCDPKWDSETMGYLRNVLGFDGVVVTDWWALRATQYDGVTDLEGNVLKDQTFEWLHARAIELGTDVFGNGSMSHETDHDKILAGNLGNFPDVVAKAFTDGTMEAMGNVDAYHESTARILRFKFRKGLFDNPYRVTEEALAVVASAEYQAEQWEIANNEDLRRARNEEEVRLTEILQAKSAVLMKNEGGVLPLAEGTKVYIDSSSPSTLDQYKAYIANFGEVVDEMEDADVCVGFFGSINDAAELFVEDAQYEGKPIVLTLTSKANEFALVNADAVLYMPYNQRPDHGSAMGGFIFETEPWVYADLLFGVREPEGIIQKEQARNTGDDAVQWKDLAGDQGASPYVRLLVQGLMMADPLHASPNNFGDPLVNYKFSMRYGQAGDFAYSCLILPQVLEQTEQENSSGSMSVMTTINNKVTAGEPFTVYCLLNNNGADDLTMAQLVANGEVIAEKLYTVCGGSFRVVEIEGVLEAGEYEITIGNTPAQTLIVE